MKFRDLFIYNNVKTSDDFTLAPAKPQKHLNGVNNFINTDINDSSTIIYKAGKVSSNLRENLEFIKDAFCKDINFDFVIREFSIPCNGKSKDGFLIFYDGLSNADYINRDILGGLLNKRLTVSSSEITEDFVFSTLITQAPLSKITDIAQVIEMVGFGNCAVFIDGCSCSFVADVKGFGGRGVGSPITEAVLSGPQEAFNEKLMINIGLIRKILKDSNLISEKVSIGEKSNTPCSLMYINGITNKSLVDEVRRRLSGIKTDYIFSSTDIEMFLEESTLFPLPQVIKTERPDRAASFLADGKVVILVQGSPFALVLPATASDLIEASEDNYVRVEEANFMKLIRILGILISLLLPGTFVAISLYHHESIPTDLLFAIEATREVVPFPIITELLIMELAFELIKEASVRIPNPIGSTIGIVGGLILGQAAVSANLVSPILIIVVSVAGLGAFATPSVSLSRAISAMRFIFIVLGGIAGFLGLAAGLCISLSALASRTSVGIPYLSPITPRKRHGLFKSIFIAPIWKREHRPQNLKTQNPQKQPHISRKWTTETEENS